MLFVLYVIMLITNLATILLPIYASLTAIVFIYIFSSVIGGTICYLISMYSIKHKYYTETKAFLIPLALIGVSLIVAIIAYCINNTCFFFIPFIYQSFMYLGLHLIHTKKSIATIRLRDTIPFIAFLYFFQWVCGNYFFVLLTGCWSFGLLVVLMYLLQTLFGGVIWFVINKYTIKKCFLSAKQAFLLPVLLILISGIMSFFIADDAGENILARDFTRVVSVFTQACQLVVYFISYAVNFAMIKLKKSR